MSLNCNFNNFINFVTSAVTRIRLAEYDADASKHVAVLTLYRILLICNMLCICWSE